MYFYVSMGLFTPDSSSSSSFMTSNLGNLGFRSDFSNEKDLSGLSPGALIDDATKYPSSSVSRS